jgi:hypothetical protein
LWKLLKVFARLTVRLVGGICWDVGGRLTSEEVDLLGATAELGAVVPGVSTHLLHLEAIPYLLADAQFSVRVCRGGEILVKGFYRMVKIRSHSENQNGDHGTVLRTDRRRLHCLEPACGQGVAVEKTRCSKINKTGFVTVTAPAKMLAGLLLC